MRGGSGFSFVDYIALGSLLMLMVGGACFVLEGGMFNGIIYSLKLFYYRTSKLGEYVEEQEKESDVGFVAPFRFRFTRPLLIVGGSVFLMTLAIACLQS
ncbi:MAG: DUF3899 domain-containing protein [Clostridia bacterium]